ncbi:matrixin family metalloprotease [Mycolicibacterium mucogenicum]|uniref:Matrixin family metalloprotease n=1 Tax=Mycolicibacterium mucogenicum DSM 44124 TaxID=1226753 RepID=A0A8E4R9W4_MYCMU|nr:matrixin family metalloprotease [Mycolicibacterium mucogenicum]QPG70540.1 matrixin family metalloprotease [Mycolicibacterium mucogenicum DSM 44124]
MNSSTWPDQWRRWSAIVAMCAVIAAVATLALMGSDRFDSIALPQAEAQPAPTGPTGGGSGGGMSGPPFPLQPPGMPDGPGAYNGGSYPAPDQGNGISIYNSGAPQGSGSQGGYRQGPNYPQQLQPANGTQPPDYDAPLQTPEPQRAPERPVQNQPNDQQPQQNSQQQQPTTVTMTVTASSEPVTSPAPSSPSASAATGNDNGSSNADQQESDTKHENTDDRSDKCPGNVAPLYANDNVDPAETNPITVKDFSPFAEFGNLINNGFGQSELTFQIASGTPDRFAKAFREAAKRWNAAQKKIDVHEVGPTGWYDFIGPSLTFNVLESDPPKASDGGYFPAETSLREERITAWSKGFKNISDEKLVGAMAHEIGHALGLDHSCKGALMYYQIGMWQATSPTPLDVTIFDMIPR